MSKLVKIENSGAILQITLNRPEKKNALTSAMYNLIADAIEMAAGDSAIRVITLTGSGGSFSSGNDIADFLEQRERTGETPVSRFMRVISCAGKPVVAGVDGLAVGIGVTMLSHFDLVYASSRATFQLPFTDLGLAPEAGSSLLMPRSIGHRRAAELMLLGSRISAQTAFDIGLINGICAPEELDALLQDRASNLARKSPASIAATRSLLRLPEDTVLAQIRKETDAFGYLLGTEEVQQNMRKFLQKKSV